VVSGTPLPPKAADFVRKVERLDGE